MILVKELYCQILKLNDLIEFNDIVRKKIHAINIFLKLKKNTSETRRKKLVKILIRITYHKYINKKYIYHISTKYIIGIYLAKLY